jgi:sugar (pentulose or hexulose) kinase
MGIYIGLDVGTTSLSALALDVEAGRVVAQVTRPNEAAVTSTGPEGLLYAELDLARLREGLLDLLAELRGRLPVGRPVEAIGVTGQQHGLALLEEDLSPARRAITWQDLRALETVPGTDKTYLQAMIRQAGGEEAFHRAGCLPAAGYMGASLYWLGQRDLLPQASAYACLIPDAALALLTETPPCTDATDAGSSGLLDVVSGQWDWQAIARLGLPRELFVPVRRAGTPHAPLAPVAAERTGLGAVPVCVAAGDNQASFIGSVRDPESSVLVNVGTGGQVSAMVHRFVRLAEVETRAFFEDRYLLVGAGLYGGRAYAYLQDFFRSVGGALFGAPPDADLFEEMNRLAAQVPPGSEGLRCTPLFTGTRAQPELRGSITGLGPTNMTPGHFARALLEGLAEGFHALYRQMEAATGARTTLVGAGNGITRNPVLAQILARRFGRDLHVAADVEAAALGAALLACAGMGERSLAEASRLVRYDRVVAAQGVGSHAG